MTGRPSRQIIIALALAALTLAVYAPVRHFDFVQVDDPLYVIENPNVRGGLTMDGIVWAFTTGRAANWHPVTWLSHMLDVQAFGVDPGWHHLTSLLLHVANALLLFGLLFSLTGALFAVHPLHVESVAWVAERKDVLSTFFWLLTTWAYVGFVRGRKTVLYGLMLVLYALGLMAKPMLVTLPFVLLLLDVWPLERLRLAGPATAKAAPGGHRPKARRAAAQSEAMTGFTAAAWPLVREKIPLFVMAAASGIVTVMVQASGGAVTGLGVDPLGLRIQNALVSTVLYLRDTFWPAGLTMLYPYPTSLPAWQVTGALAVVVGVSWLVWRQRQTRPWLLVGWLWYLGTLVPVSGIVRVGLQARADRYTYVPLIGFFIIMAWGVAALAERRPRLRPAVAAAALVAVLGCAWVARAQAYFWEDNVALWTRATMQTMNVGEYAAHMSLGTALGNQGRLDEAAEHFAAAVRLRPRSDAARLNLAIAFGKLGRTNDAARELDEALRLNPGNETAARLKAELRR
jgi:hypothetical protein